MTLSIGDRLPEATLCKMGENGPETVQLSDLTKDRKVVIFALPGAFTPACSDTHLPGYEAAMDDFAALGVDEVICLSVNDAFVMKAWGDSTGATSAGITMLGDVDSAFTKAIGMNFTVPPIGFFDRSKRYALYAVDGVVKVLHAEENAGQCDISGGEAMLAAI